MLGTSAVLVCVLWYRLGGSADYHKKEIAPSEHQEPAAPSIRGPVEPPMAELTESSSRVNVVAPRV